MNVPKSDYSYRLADHHIIINDDDPDLRPIKIMLPYCPDLHLIDGYGLPPKKQKYQRPEYPVKLKILEDEVMDELNENERRNKHEKATGQKFLDLMWEKVEQNRAKLRDEIDWIKKQWYYRMNGYWFFNNGKPTYIDGWHYVYCGFWSMEDVGYPEYRDRDRRFFIAARYFYTTTESFKNLDPDTGHAIPDEDGKYEVIDTGFRTFYGFTYPKHRRDGATHKCLDIHYEIISKMIGVLGGIQSFDEDNAGDHFKTKLVPAWKKMPFFFKPMWNGSMNPQKSLNFSNPSNKIADELGSKMDFATTANRKFYDGKKQYSHLSDENGKTILENISERHDVVKLTLSQGAGSVIHGFSMHPSTVAEMREKGGDNYYNLCEDSNFYIRDIISGQTHSGLGRIFMPADDGLENFVGEYGESIIEKPTKAQAEFIGRNYGSREFIEKRKSQLLAIGTPEAMRRYRQFVEQHPQCYADCFRITEGDIGFDIEIIDKAIMRLRRDKDIPEKSTVEGNFKWIINGQSHPLTSKEYIELGLMKNNVEGRVEWFPEKGGKWKMSKILGEKESNLKMRVDDTWIPSAPDRFTACGDPFKFLNKTESGYRKDNYRLSKGGLSVFWHRDTILDSNDKNILDWESYRFVLTYNTRTDDEDEFAEDCLMSCIYYGAMMFPEINVRLLWKHFIRRGYGGYLKYPIDEATGKVKDRPGFTSLGETKQDLFNAWKTYIKWHFHRERHLDLVEECKKIRGVEYMTDFDLFTSGGGCLLGIRSGYSEFIESMQEDLPLDDFIEMYEVN